MAIDLTNKSWEDEELDRLGEESRARMDAFFGPQATWSAQSPDPRAGAPAGFTEDPSGSESDPFAAATGGGSIGMGGTWEYQFPRDPSSKERPAIGSGTGVYTFAGGMLGMSRPQVRMAMGYMGLSEDMPTKQIVGGLVQYSFQRGGGAHIAPWKGDVAPSTAQRGTVAEHGILAQGRAEEYVSGVKEEEIYSGQRAYHWSRALAIPGVTMTPEGEIATGAMKESKLSKALHLGTQQYQTYYEGLGDPTYSKVTATGATIPEYGQRTMAWLAFGRTTPEGAGWRDPSVGTPYTMIPKQVTLPEGAEPLLEPGMRFGRGQTVIPYEGHEGIDVPTHYAGWEVTHVGRYTRGPEDDREERLALEFKATLPEGALASWKGGGVKTGLVEQVGTQERWGAQFVSGDIREFAQLGAAVAGAATAEEQRQIWGQEISGEYTYEHAQKWREYLLTPGVIHEEWSRKPALYREASPITQAKEEAGILRRAPGPLTEDPRPAGFRRGRMGMRAGADTPPASVTRRGGRRRAAPEGTFWGQEASVGVRVPMLAQTFMAWDWSKQQEGLETRGYLAEAHPNLVRYYAERGRESGQAAIGIGRAFFAQQGIGREGAVDVTNLPAMERIRIEELAARRVQRESGMGPDDPSYGRLLPRAFMATLGEEYEGQLLRYSMEGEKDVYAPSPGAALAYTGAMRPGAQMRGLPRSMYNLIRSQWEGQEGTYRTRAMREQGKLPTDPTAMRERVLEEQAGLMQAIRVGRGTTPGVQEITESGTYRRRTTGLDISGGRFGGQVQPVNQLPQTRWVGGRTVLREHLQTRGLGAEQVDELVEQMVTGKREGPAVVALRHPMLVKSQAQAVLGYMSQAEWVSEGYGTEEEYGKFETTAGVGRAVAGVGGGDWDVDPYDIIMATAFNRTKAGGITRQDLFGGQPLTSEELWELAERHGAGELGSEIGKILDPGGTGKTESERVQYALEQVRAGEQRLTPERFREVALQREVSRSQTGLIFNQMIRGMGQRITGDTPAAMVAREELGPLALTAIDQMKRSEELTRLVRTSATLKKSSGGYTTLSPTGETGPGFVGSRTESIVRQQVGDIIGMPEKGISLTTRAAMIYDPGKDPGTYEGVLRALRGEGAKGVPGIDVWDPLTARAEKLGGLEALTREMPIPGYTLEQAARRGMKEAGQIVTPESGKTARLYQPGETDIGMAARGKSEQELIAALSGGKDIPLPQAIEALLSSEQPEQREAGGRLLSQLGITRAQNAAIAGTPEERIRAQAAGAQPPSKPPTPPAAAAAAAAPEPGGGEWSEDMPDYGEEDPFGPPSTTTRPTSTFAGASVGAGMSGGVRQAGRVDWSTRRNIPSAARPSSGTQPTEQVQQAQQAPGTGAGAMMQAARTLAGAGSEDVQWTMGNVPGRGMWSSIGPKFDPYTSDMQGKAQELMGRIGQFAQTAGAPLGGGRPFTRPELGQFKQVGGFMQELQQISGSAESGGAQGIQTTEMIQRFMGGGAARAVMGGEALVERQAWEQAQPNLRDPNMLGWLNQANIQGLQRMPGVGPARAGAIGGLRTRFGNLQGVGGITDLGQLAQISGISQGMVAGEMYQGVATEGAIWAAGGREAIGGLGAALTGAGMTTPEGVAANPQLRQMAGLYQRNVRAIGEGAPQEWQQLAASMGAAGEQVAKEQAVELVNTLKELKPDLVERFNERLTESVTGLRDLSGTLDKIQERAGGPGGLGRYDRGQLAGAGRLLSQAQRSIGELERAGDITPAQAARRRAHMGQYQEQLFDIQREQAEPGGFWGGRVGAGIRGVGKYMMSGWGLMQMRRFWGMTGGAAMQQIPLAAQREQVAMQGAMVGVPAAQQQFGGMGLDLMSYRAAQQDFRADVGEAAYRAVGTGIQGNQGLATVLGVGAVPTGAGLIAGRLASAAGAGMGSAAALGFGVGAIGAAWAGTNYLRSIGQDEGQVAEWNAPEASWWQRGVAGLGAGFAGNLPGQEDVYGTAPGNLAPWLAQEIFQYRGTRFAGWLDQQEAAGQRLETGDIAGLGVNERMRSFRMAARGATETGQPLSFMTDTGAMQLGQQWMRYVPQENYNEMFQDETFQAMARRGDDPQMFAAMAGQWGQGPAGVGGTAEQFYAQTDPMQWAYSGQFYSQFARFGMTQEMMGQLPRVQNAQQGQFIQRLAGGSQLAWSQFGMETGQDWAVTQDPTTGMGIGTNWGGDILGQRLGQVGAAGREIDVQGGQITFNVTGQQVEFTQWDIQDYQRQQQEGFQDWQYGFRTQGMDLALGRQQQVWGFEDEGRGLGRARQWEQFGFQREGAQMGDRQFRERWNINWQQLGITSEWQQDDRSRQWARAQTQFGWQREDLAFRGAQTSLQFGWQAEDLEEGLRTATGRQRRQIRKQQERAAISYGMGMGQLETQGERINTREQWAQEDFERAQERHEQTTQWRQAEMQLQLRHHTERTGLQQRQQSAAEQYFRSTSALQDRQTVAARRYWTDTHNRQRRAIEMERQYHLAIREVQIAQIALGQAQQLQMANFRMEWETGGAVQRSFGQFFAWLDIQIARRTAGIWNPGLQ